MSGQCHLLPLFADHTRAIAPHTGASARLGMGVCMNSQHNRYLNCRAHDAPATSLRVRSLPKGPMMPAGNQARLVSIARDAYDNRSLAAAGRAEWGSR